MAFWKRILIPLDGSMEDEVAIGEARRVAAPDAIMHLMHVVPPTYPSVGEEPTQRLELASQAEEYLEDVRVRVGVGPGPDLVRAGEPGDQILRASLELNIDLIAMATHGRRGLGRAIMGSVAQEIVRGSQLPVLLVRPGIPLTAPGLRRILVPLDGSEFSNTALNTVRPVAEQAEAEVILLHVREPAPDPAPQWSFKGPRPAEGEPEGRVQGTADQLEEKCGLFCESKVVRGAPAEEILREARERDVDLIAMTTHGRTGLERALLGSVAEAVVRGADRAVLVQRPLVMRRARREGGSRG